MNKLSQLPTVEPVKNNKTTQFSHKYITTIVRNSYTTTIVYKNKLREKTHT